MSKISGFTIGLTLISLLSILIIKPNILSNKTGYKTYTFSDHRYKITFEYPENFEPPTENYYATSNIIQNKFTNDTGAELLFVTSDLGNYRDLNNCRTDNSCNNWQGEGFIKTYSGDVSDNSVGFNDPELHLSYGLTAKLNGDDPQTQADVKHTLESFKVEDVFHNTESWESVDFDEVLKLKYPVGVEVSHDTSTIDLTDPHHYNIHISRLSEYNSGQEYLIWKKGYLGIFYSRYPKTKSLDFIKTINGSEQIYLQATLYIDGLVYKVTSDPLIDIRYDEGEKLSSEMIILKDVYLKPGSDPYKYLDYIKKIVELVEINNSNVDNVKSKLEGDSTITDTSDWITYMNDELGFSFKYPSDLKVEIRKDGDYFRMFILDTELGHDYDFMALKFAPLDSLTLEEWFEKTVDINDVLSYKNGTTAQGYRTLTPEGSNSPEDLRGYWLTSLFVEDKINARALAVFGPLYFYPLETLEPYQPSLLNNIVDSIQFYKVN